MYAASADGDQVSAWADLSAIMALIGYAAYFNELHPEQATHEVFS